MTRWGDVSLRTGMLPMEIVVAQEEQSGGGDGGELLRARNQRLQDGQHCHGGLQMLYW